MGNGEWGIVGVFYVVYVLPITDYQLPITNYQLPITNYQLPIVPVDGAECRLKASPARTIVAAQDLIALSW